MRQDKIALQKQLTQWQEADAIKAAKIQELNQKMHEDNIDIAQFLTIREQFTRDLDYEFAMSILD